jgi:hypothetical protein
MTLTKACFVLVCAFYIDYIHNIHCVRNRALHKSTGIVDRRTGHEDPEWKKRYSSILSFTWTLHGRGGGVNATRQPL